MPKRQYTKLSNTGLRPVMICSDNGDSSFTGLGFKNAAGVSGLSVFMEDRTAPVVDQFFTNLLNTTTIAADTVADAYTFEATPGHGIVTGNTVEIFVTANGDYFRSRVIGVATDTITVNTPLPRVFLAGSPLLVENANMLVTGTPGAPVVFSIRPDGQQELNITRMFFRITSTSAQGIATFGADPALTYGLTLRKRRPDGTFSNIFTWRDNGEFLEHSGTADFRTAVGGSIRGFTAWRVFAGDNENGTAIRLNAADAEQLQIVVADDLVTGTANVTIEAVAQGYQVA